MIKTINVDMDGVIYDMYGAFALMDECSCQFYWFNKIKELNMTPEEYIKENFYEYSNNGLFTKGYMLNDTMKLFGYLIDLRDNHGIKINLLGALPEKNKKHIKTEKIKWLKDNNLYYIFDEIIFVDGSKSKIKYGSSDSVLIDDYTKTQKRFMDKSYPFILHRTSTKTIDQLKWFEF